MTVEELQVKITVNQNELQKELGKANKGISGLQNTAKKSAVGMGDAFKKLKQGIIALGLGKIIKDSIQSGMDAIESDSLFETSLAANADAVRAWSDEVSSVLGLNAVAVRKNTGTIFNMTSSMGIAEENALKMSKGISLLSEDMASFYNLDSEEAFNKLKAGITGEAEPLKALGILVDENTIKQVAYSEGIAENGAELTQQQKVLARYVAILKQTGNAQGDLARTMDSPSNQLRALKSQVTQLGISLSNFFIPVVKAVLPWVSAFTQVATQALNKLKPLADALAKFLGVSSGGSASAETEKISENVGGLASGYDDATKSAKKLKNSLAGFDEMNTLTDNTSDGADAASGSAGSATVGVDFDLSEYDAHLDWVNNNTNALVEKIQGTFSSIGAGINFDNLFNAFNNLKTSLEPITATLFDGLKWAWDNILVPLGQWTIGEAVPAFMDALSGTLEVLNPLLESFKNVGGWLWDNFLQPVASWAGDVTVDILTGLGDALTAIGDWASANQETIDAMVATFATFFGLWKLTEILAFIQMSGGLIGAITGITTAIWGSITAKIADKAQTIALTLMYAKDFVTSLAKGTAEIVKQVAQWALLTGAKALDAIKTGVVTAAQTIWNALSGVGAAVTTALGAAFNFLCSPITLVVLAIAAVIAIVILLVKNWDTVKETAIKVWDKIKEIWGVVADWIKSKVVDPIKNFFSGLWDGIKNIFSGVGTWFKNVFTGAWEGIKTAFSKVTGFFKGIWDSIKEIFGKVGSVIADAVGGTVKKAINTVLSVAIKIINGFISAINLAISAINLIPGVNIKKLNKLEVPKLARGGIIDRPTVAMVGEAGKEAVMPLERNTGWIDQLAVKIGEKIGGATGNIKLIVKLGEEAIFDRFIEYGKDKAFETNGEVVFV